MEKQNVLHRFKNCPQKKTLAKDVCPLASAEFDDI
jgi:hypothetical protein